MAKPWEKYQSKSNVSEKQPEQDVIKPWERKWEHAPDPTTGMSDDEFVEYMTSRIDKSRKMDNAKKQMTTLGGAIQTSGERILNAATLGGYGALNDALGGNFDERNKVGEQNLKNAGLGAVNTVSNLINDIAGGAPVGAGIWNLTGKMTKRIVPHMALSAALGGGTYAGLNSRGDARERLTDAGVGAVVGAITAPVLYGAQKIAGKAIGNVMDKVNSKHASAKYADVAGDMGKIADDTDAFRAIKKGVKANDDIARIVRDQTDELLKANSDDVSVGVAKVLDGAQIDKNGNTVAKNLDMVKESYADFIKQYGSMSVDKQEVAKIIKRNPEIADYIKAAQTHGPTTGMPENSFGVLHEANRRMKMDLRDRMINNSSKLQDKSYGSSALDKLLDTKFGERAYLDKAFRRNKLKFDMINTINTANASETSNFAGKLLTREMKQQVAELYGPETADALSEYLRGASRKFDNVKGLNTAAKSKLHEIGADKRPFLREMFETVGSIAGNAMDAATANYRRRMNANIAARILEGNVGKSFGVSVSPYLSALLATHNAGMTPDNMNTLRAEEQALDLLPLSRNKLSPKGSDRYYHERGQYKNAQKGLEHAYNSQMIGLMKEIKDMPGKLLRGVDVGTAVSDMLQDLTFNKDGGIEGLYNKTPAKDNKYLNNTKTKEMRLLEKALGGIP